MQTSNILYIVAGNDISHILECQSYVISYMRWGEVAERLMAPLSKSGSRHGRDVGSNPTLSAESDIIFTWKTWRVAGVAEQARLEIV